MPTAALIVGGYWYYGEGDPILPRVELFGCPGAKEDSFPMADFPDDNYLAAGVVLDNDDKVMLCGGYTCGETTCNTRSVGFGSAACI